mgnify:FL=1
MTQSHEEPSTVDGLMSRVRVIEEQPLAGRAQAYTALHTQFSPRLEQPDIGTAARAL